MNKYETDKEMNKVAENKLVESFDVNYKPLLVISTECDEPE